MARNKIIEEHATRETAISMFVNIIAQFPK